MIFIVLDKMNGVKSFKLVRHFIYVVTIVIG